jgi:cyanate lyase
MKDLNTGFFHRQAKWRARKNKIKKLKKTDGTFTEDPREMKDLSVAFFADLYKMDEGVSPHQVLSLVEPREMQDMNLGLSNDFPEKEISDALFQTDPLKAPGPDGFLVRFYQTAIVKGDVVAIVHKFFSDGVMPEGINDTSIVLIPKDNDPEELTDFQTDQPMHCHI